MHTISKGHVPVRRSSIEVRVSVRPHEHGLSGVHYPKIQSSLPRKLSRFLELLHLRPVHLPYVECRLHVAPEGLRPRAAAPGVPRAVLEMRRRKCPQERHPLMSDQANRSQLKIFFQNK